MFIGSSLSENLELGTAACCLVRCCLQMWGLCHLYKEM